MAGDAAQDFEVWADNLESLDCFIACRTQWRMLPSAHGKALFLGLEYRNVKVMLKSRKLTDWRAVFNDIQVMEWAALAVLNAA